MHIATNSDQIDISIEKKTQKLAQKFQEKLKIGDVVFLEGEMGVGKTTFIKYLINYFQKKNKIKLSEVTSPTFNLLNEYKIDRIQIYHYDLFRIKTFKDLKNLDLFANNSNSITLIEWPQIIQKKPRNCIELKFTYSEDFKKRFIKIKGINL
ncbi:MAG: tRNA (adenosine(37)-N6)-threonylcarbamoyltransferase complex ATPase subunit type 1 TsaE [Magnetovibrio sp.]|nr:tRNA (adenosine(37)-N6)-threonylcarbamoyltransferase complex ATPase subunit type 1 TsaE [Magnetovibrio sp.]